MLGELSFGTRLDISNPLDDRYGHWVNGWKVLLENPILGRGLLSKFLDDYGNFGLNYFHESKDPHNLFVYTGLVGGLPLLFITIVFYLRMLIRILFLRDNTNSIFIFMLITSFLSMFVVGGSLLSLPSFIDRFFG